MKKIIAIILISIVSLTVTSCGEGDVVHNEPSEGTNMNDQWFSHLGFDDTLNTPNTNFNHHIINLPADINDSLRLVRINVTREVNRSRFDNLRVSFGSTYNRISRFESTIMNDLVEYKEDINLPYGTEIPENWSTYIAPTETQMEQEEIFLYKVFLPIEFEHIILRDGIRPALTTHVIIPIFMGFEAPALEGITPIELQVSNGRLT